MVGSGARVGAGATVTGSVLLPGAIVGAGAVVEDSIVAGAVGDGARVVRTVVGADAMIPDGEHVLDARIPATRRLTPCPTSRASAPAGCSSSAAPGSSARTSSTA